MERLDGDGGAWVKATVYGDSGSGKTSLAVTAPRPLILLSERQGMLSIKQAAKRLGVPVPAVLYCTTLDDYRRVTRALFAAKDKPFRVLDSQKREVLFELPVSEWPQTVVLDSITDVCRIVSEEIRTQSPPKAGKDGLPVDSERYWNVLGDRIANIIHAFRDAPLHTLYLALKDDREVGDEGDKKRQVGPAMIMRKLPAALSASGNLTAYAYRRETRKGKDIRVTHGVMTVGPEYMLLKPCAPLRPVEVPDFGYWVRAINGALEPAPDAPDVSNESMAASALEPEPSPGVQEEREVAAALERHAAEPGPKVETAVDRIARELPEEDPTEAAERQAIQEEEQLERTADHHAAVGSSRTGDDQGYAVHVPAGGSDSVREEQPAPEESKTQGAPRQRRKRASNRA